VALSTRGVLATPAVAVRTVKYSDWSIDYQVRFFIDDYERQLEINEEFMTKVWYAAKRNRLTIPFPIQTTYEHRIHMPPAPPNRAADALTKVPVFVPLAPDELEALSRDAVRQDYGRGERVVHQGDTGDSLYLIQEGTAIVTIKDEHGGEREVARLSRGEFFGEMAVLTGEPRTASVSAVDDLGVLVIYKEALQNMLQKRPALAQEMAETMAARKHGLRAIQEMKTAPPEQRARIQSGAAELLKGIKRFFGL
jgi:CRP-like cAMP-binding protein